MGFSISVLNNIRMNLDTDYQARIPEATQTNLASIGQAFSTYDVQYNEFLSELMHKIGRTILEQASFTNKLAKFKQGKASPHDVEEIFIEMLKAEGSYDKDGKNPLGRRTPPNAKVAYHRQNRQDYYVISIGDIDFVRVFRSEATLDAWITGLFNAVYMADERDEWLCMKNLLATYKNAEGTAPGYFDYEVLDMDKATSKEQFAKDFVKTTRKAVQDVQFLSADYNVAGVETNSKPEELVMFVNKDVLVEVDVELLAKAFHQSNTDMKVVPEIVSMDDFGTLTDTYALIVPRSWFKVWDTLVKMEPQRNAQGLFTNWFYHHHQILSASPFKNALRLKRVDATA